MKVLLVTEAWARHRGPYQTLFPFFRDTLATLGHEIAVVDNKAMHLPLSGQTVWNCPRLLRALGWVRWNDRIVNALLRSRARSWQPDLILMTKAENIRCATVHWLRQHTRAVLFNWDADNPFWPTNTSMDLLRAMPHLHCFGSLAQHFVPSLLSLGCPRVEYLPMFFTPERFAPPTGGPAPEQDRGFACDLFFAGIGTPERAAMLRPLADRNLALYGDWNLLTADDPLRRCLRGNYLDGPDYAAALRSCRIAINVLNQQCRGANNLRTFEATGCGAFLLTEYSDEQAKVLFRTGEEIVCYRSNAELCALAEHFLDEEEARRRIAEAGQKRCLREHRLDHRLRRILDVALELHEGGVK